MSDLGFAAQLAEDLSPDDLRMVLAVFGTDVKRLSATLEEAAGAGDLVAFRRAAHGLAGAAGAVGAARLELACRRAMADTDPLEMAMADIGLHAGRALDDLAGFLAGLDGAA